MIKCKQSTHEVHVNYLPGDEMMKTYGSQEVDCKGSREKNVHKNFINKFFTSHSRRESVEKIFAKFIFH